MFQKPWGMGAKIYLLFLKILGSKKCMKKYIDSDSIDDWLTNIQSVSIIWREVVLAFPLVGNWLVLKVGCGTKVKVGEDP